MILSEIRSYLKKVGGAGLSELSRELNYETGVVEQALETWIRKGKVELISPESACSGCSCGSSADSCGSLTDLIKVYRWTEDK